MARATRTPGPQGSPEEAGGACPSSRPSAVRAARCRAERARIQSFTALPNSSKTGRQPLKNTVPHTTSATPPTPATPGPSPRGARTSAFPRRAGEPRRPQHMRALCFPCSRALPTCRAGGTPVAPPPAPHNPPEPRVKTCWRRARAHTSSRNGSCLYWRQATGAAGRHRRPPHRPHAGNPAHRAGAARGRPHAATCATDGTCLASPRPQVLPLSSVHELGHPRNY